MSQDRIDAERYRALRDFRKEYFPFFWYAHPRQIRWFKVPESDFECDEAVDQMIERYRSYVE